ncbi:hypothetical protein [Candidatus Palauibacter sp.]|uniref:hypothetical protein n=1 Tax=Candidatus Palauibacter sp. TaxID=3101350 RepID=UPI003AF2F1C7
MALTAKLVFKVWTSSRPPAALDEIIDVWGEPAFDLVGSTRFAPLTQGRTTYSGVSVEQAVFRVRSLPDVLFSDDVADYGFTVEYDGKAWALADVIDLDRRFQRITLRRDPDVADSRKPY